MLLLHQAQEEQLLLEQEEAAGQRRRGAEGQGPEGGGHPGLQRQREWRGGVRRMGRGELDPTLLELLWTSQLLCECRLKGNRTTGIKAQVYRRISNRGVRTGVVKTSEGWGERR